MSQPFYIGGTEAAVTTAETTLVQQAMLNNTAWCLIVKADGGNSANVAVKVYKSVGPNAGFVELTALATTLAAGASTVIEYSADSSQVIKVTATAASGTQSASWDFGARSVAS